jgi:hypothetical protein
LKTNRLFSGLFSTLAGLLVLSFAAQSPAVVTVTHATTGSTNLNIGDTIVVTVSATWDGAGSLQGVFSSTLFDTNVLALQSARFGTGTLAFKGSLFAGVDPNSTPTSLARFGGQDLRFSSDPLSVIRTIQYGSLDPIDPSGAKTELITTLTFQAIAQGTSTVGYFEAIADTGAQGDTTTIGAPVTVTVPEPHEIMLGLAALGSVAGAIVVRRRI